MNQITRSVTVYQRIRDRILGLEADLDDATLADTLEGATDLHQVVASVVRSALVDDAMAEGIKSHITALRDRQQKLHERALARREIAREAMLEVELKKISAPDFTISLRPGSASVVVAEEGSIPSAYWQPQEPRLDRVRLLTDLKRGFLIPGVRLSEPDEVLSVRIR